MINIIKTWITGFLIGIANIIPGVSGGTFLLIFGIYERTITAINGSVGLVKNALPLLPKLIGKKTSGQARQTFLDLVKKSDIIFLFQILGGALIAVIVLSAIMEMLLTHHFSPTYSFFFGLIVVSLIIPVKLLKKYHLSYLFFLTLGLVLTIYLSVSVNPADKIIQKSEIYQARLASQETAGDQEEQSERRFSYSGKYTVVDLLYAGFSGAVAISAMVLPGISGSLVLILMGQYFEVISAISGLKTLQLDYMIFLAVLLLGIIVGILLFAKLVEFIFKRYYDFTISFLTGLMLGSLYTLWPFKKYLVQDIFEKDHGQIMCLEDSVIYTNINILPEDIKSLIFAIIFCVIGMGIMGVMIKMENRKKS